MSPDRFFEFYGDASEWIELLEFLQEGLQDVPPSDWTPGVPVPMPGNPLGERQHYRDELRKIYGVYGREVREACGARFFGDAWPEMSPPVAYWAGIALGHAILFVRGLCFGPDDRECVTIFPFPDASIREVAAWFATDWWNAAGYEFYLARACSDAAIFVHQFKH